MRPGRRRDGQWHRARSPGRGVQGMWQALNGHEWSGDLAPLAAALAQKAGYPARLAPCCTCTAHALCGLATQRWRSERAHGAPHRAGLCCGVARRARSRAGRSPGPSRALEHSPVQGGRAGTRAQRGADIARLHQHCARQGRRADGPAGGGGRRACAHAPHRLIKSSGDAAAQGVQCTRLGTSPRPAAWQASWLRGRAHPRCTGAEQALACCLHGAGLLCEEQCRRRRTAWAVAERDGWGRRDAATGLITVCGRVPLLVPPVNELAACQVHVVSSMRFPACGKQMWKASLAKGMAGHAPTWSANAVRTFRAAGALAQRRPP